MTKEHINNLGEAEAGNDYAWEAPVQVRRGEAGTISIPADLAARAAFLAQVHHLLALRVAYQIYSREY
jgi:hypothetical protein